MGMDIKHIYIPSVHTNCYLLADTDGAAAAVIDPGDDVTASVAHYCADCGYGLQAIFLTHGHYDHVEGVNALRQKFPGIKVHLHPGDIQGEGRIMPTAALGPLTPWQDGDTISLGTLSVEVLHTPGHTKGSVCLRCSDALFTGDTLFAGECGRTDLPGGSYGEMMASLRRLGELEGNCDVYPGHGWFSTLDAERQSNPYMKRAMEGTV